MYTHIMVPVDLRHPPEVGKALYVAGDLAKAYGARVTLVSVTGHQPAGAPHDDRTAEVALTEEADRLAEKAGVEVEAMNIFSPDVPAELNSALTRAVENSGADLVVVGSHVPGGILDAVFGTHAGHLADHAKVSVFVVR